MKPNGHAGRKARLSALLFVAAILCAVIAGLFHAARTTRLASPPNELPREFATVQATTTPIPVASLHDSVVSVIPVSISSTGITIPPRRYVIPAGNAWDFDRSAGPDFDDPVGKSLVDTHYQPPPLKLD
jgi:hypothetical protein